MVGIEETTRYPHTLNFWKRIENPPELRGMLDRTKISSPEFGAINRWHVTEKIDGTNIRVLMRWLHDEWTVEFFTREGTDQNITWGGAKEFLHKTFTQESMFRGIDLEKIDKSTVVVLYGELYGHGIQKWGRKYVQSDVVDWAMFDARIIDESGDWWLEREAVEGLAAKIGVKTAPVLATDATTQEILGRFIIGKEPQPQLTSRVSTSSGRLMEGIVARSVPMMMFRKTKTPIQFKLKWADFRRGEDGKQESKGSSN